jgi:beta-lactamase regulating signal transducer with metallopeptidase domain
MSPWIESVLRAGIQGCLLAAVVFLIVTLFKRLSPAVRCALWWLVLAEFSVGCLFAFPLRSGALEPLRRLEGKVQVAAGQAGGGAVATPTKDGPSNGVPKALFGVWLLGVIAVLGSGAVATCRLARIRKASVSAVDETQAEARRLSAELGLPAPPTVLVSTQICSPATFGLFRPAVLVPESFQDLTAGEREMALTHELAHVIRRDGLFALVAEFAAALFWFLPVVHWVRRAWAVERELACDAMVYSRPAIDRSEYRKLLLKIVGKDAKPMPRTALGATADFRCLRRRLTAAPVVEGMRAKFAGLAAVLGVAVLAVPVTFQAQTTDGGLLSNAGFEEGGETPWGWVSGERLDKVRYVWDDSVAHTGRRSLGFKKTVERYYPIAQWTQTVAYDGKSSAIEFGAWVKAKGMYKAVLDVQFATEEGVATHEWVAFIGIEKDGDLPATHDWKRLGGVVKIPAGTKQIILALQDYGPGEVWFDDVSARFVPGTK